MRRSGEMGHCKDMQTRSRWCEQGPLLFEIKVVLELQTLMLAEGLAPTARGGSLKQVQSDPRGCSGAEHSSSEVVWVGGYG